MKRWEIPPVSLVPGFLTWVLLCSFCFAQEEDIIAQTYDHPSKFMRGDFVQLIYQARNAPKSVVVDPKGEFAEIDVADANQVLEQLLSADPAVREQAIARFKEDPERMTPPVFFVAASQMYEAGQKEDAVRWLLIGRVRALNDIFKCKDETVVQAIAVLNYQVGANLGTEFRRYRTLMAAIDYALAWDQSHPRRYDERWIALYGNDAFERSEIRFAPKEKWEDVNKANRRRFRNAMLEWVDSCRDADKDKDGFVSDDEVAAVTLPPLEIDPKARARSMCDDQLIESISNGSEGIRMLERVNFPYASNSRVVDIELLIPPGAARNWVERWTVERDGAGPCYYTVTMIPDGSGGSHIVTSSHCKPIPVK
jgi:hypothetical protein